jgi:hypothetical protein
MNPLTVNSLVVTTRTQPNTGGNGLVRVFVVTFKVGSHGPFELVYLPAAYTATQVKADIDAQVQTLNQLTQNYPQG